MFTRPASFLVPAVSLRSAQILHAVEPVERLQQLLRMRIGHPVDDLLTLAAGLDEVFCTQHTELLRQGGLPDAEQLLKLPDRFFSLAQLTQQKQAVFIGQDPQEVRCLVSSGPHAGHVDGDGVHKKVETG